MQKGREVRDNIHEPRGFGDFGGFGFHSRMMPSLFGGRDPFDDPFFTDPLDRLFSPSSGSRAMQKTNKDKGIVIEELDPDDEGIGSNCPEPGEDFDLKYSKPTKEPSVEHPDDYDDNERRNSDATYKNDHYMAEPPKARNFTFKTSRVSYGGIDGAYYTSSRTRRTGSDGVVMEESKEADSTTGQASHRISRGIHDKGHSVLRKLDSDGKVDTTQTLHNLNEDELIGFEEAWKGNNNIGQLPGFNVHGNKDSSCGKQNRNQVWPLQSLEKARRARGFASNNETGTNSGGRTKKVVRINID
ncbi:uncharacterized protein LOC113850263 [Abrus precatorius]|uniref:Uncharacterized protein LOC113850263 n=1 Tax=Abrus precatorius TaxID=3816 RepID=A0A8B8K0M6_ABRPR|nr:uncharacterized protein LOC113850263 [Abrus precatorius]